MINQDIGVDMAVIDIVMVALNNNNQLVERYAQVTLMNTWKRDVVYSNIVTVAAYAPYQFLP